MTEPTPNLHGMTADIVSAYVANHQSEADALPALIKSVFDALKIAGEPPAPEEEKKQPAVPIRRSVFPDYIVCLEDGKKLKMLKRHLKTTYNLTPEEYRERWGLPPEYPMVAPSYAQHRSELAQKIGLGRKGKVEKATETEEAPAPARRGRKRKAQE